MQASEVSITAYPQTWTSDDGVLLQPSNCPTPPGGRHWSSSRDRRRDFESRCKYLARPRQSLVTVTCACLYCRYAAVHELRFLHYCLCISKKISDDFLNAVRMFGLVLQHDFNFVLQSFHPRSILQRAHWTIVVSAYSAISAVLLAVSKLGLKAEHCQLMYLVCLVCQSVLHCLQALDVIIEMSNIPSQCL